ncbi:MAG: hypothetical protein RBG13Loki_0651 [Promethearchaeota archaeon CR_4]|nr:MAG: hypothetical protein RBG13Loki_0651 [Candidatus Lokiarchaeota archaeon CR_4]
MKYFCRKISAMRGVLFQALQKNVDLIARGEQPSVYSEESAQEYLDNLSQHYALFISENCARLDPRGITP